MSEQQNGTTDQMDQPQTRFQPEPREPREEQDANRVQRTASLHEKAVQAIADGTVAPVAKKTRKTPERRVQRLTKDITVREEVMTAAREIIMGLDQWAGRGYSRLQIIDEDTVIVR